MLFSKRPGFCYCIRIGRSIGETGLLFLPQTAATESGQLLHGAYAIRNHVKNRAKPPDNLLENIQQ